MEKYKNQISEIVAEITNKYYLKHTLLSYVLCSKKDNTGIVLNDNFYYSSPTKKALINKIYNDCVKVETYPGELDRYADHIVNMLDTIILQKVKEFYNIQGV